jgi:hypothetical protein
VGAILGILVENFVVILMGQKTKSAQQGERFLVLH